MKNRIVLYEENEEKTEEKQKKGKIQPFHQEHIHIIEGVSLPDQSINRDYLDVNNQRVNHSLLLFSYKRYNQYEKDPKHVNKQMFLYCEEFHSVRLIVFSIHQTINKMAGKDLLIKNNVLL